MVWKHKINVPISHSVFHFPLSIAKKKEEEIIHIRMDFGHSRQWLSVIYILINIVWETEAQIENTEIAPEKNVMFLNEKLLTFINHKNQNNNN